MNGELVVWSYPAGRTRRELRELVARVFGWWSGVATGGSQTTIVDSRLARFADDYWLGATAWLVYKSNVPQGYEVTVTDFASSTGTLTVTPAFDSSCVAGDEYQLFRYISKRQIDDALNESCRGALARCDLTPNSDYSLAYSLSAFGLLRPSQIAGVYVVPQGDERLYPLMIEGWRCEEDQGVFTLWLPRAVNVNDDLYILYRLGEGVLIGDDVRITTPSDLVQARAVVFLLQNMLADQDTQGLEKWGQLLRYWTERLQALDKQYGAPTGRTRRPDWRRTDAPSSEHLWRAYGLEEWFA